MRSKAAYKIEKAVSPKGLIAWAVVDELFEMHYEASAFLYWLRDGMSRSENTTETYARRIALFLSWTIRNNIDWRTISLTQLVRYKRWLAETPIGRDEARLTGDRSTYRLRAGVTVNAHITAVSGMIRFAARQRLIESHVAEQLSEQRYMTSIPRGYDVGEDNQWRTYRARLLVATEEEPAIETLTDDEILRLLAECRNRRDRFLIYALRCTGVRIGELLGMRRSDMHLLPSSKHVRCSFAGPHIHVRRREDNDNFALSKSRRSRAIPVDDQYVEMYMDYRAERDRVPAALSSDLVMVNLFREPLGRGMTYDNAESLLQRLSRRSDFYARPHMLRHTFATRLLESGASIDTVRELLGHQSISSTGVYLHADQADMRAAVLKVSLNLGDSA